MPLGQDSVLVTTIDAMCAAVEMVDTTVSAARRQRAAAVAPGKQTSSL